MGMGAQRQRRAHRAHPRLASGIADRSQGDAPRWMVDFPQYAREPTGSFPQDVERASAGCGAELWQSHRQSRANRAHGGNLPQFGSDGMLATLRQQLASGLLAQGLQQVQLLIELLGAATGAGLGNFPQPLTAMAGIVNVPSGTGNRPATIDRFQPIHHPGNIFDDSQITAGELPQHAYTVLAMVDRLELIEPQKIGQFAGIDLVTFVAMFEQSILARIAHYYVGN